MVLHPRFYEPIRLDRRAERLRLGLDPDRLTALALFGGEGSMDLVRVARALENSGLPTQLILLCGRHDEAARQVRNLGGRMPMLVEGFTKQVPYYMALADYFIGKPGPGSISEALAMRLPVIVEKNAWTLAHERYNADWMVERGTGMALDSFAQLPRAVEELLQPDRYRVYKEATERIRNFAVFEIPEMLEQILAESRFAEIPAFAELSSEPAAVTPAA
jgi:1,2-diacylglycerol 3-beta-galactosyltransferase